MGKTLSQLHLCGLKALLSEDTSRKDRMSYQSYPAGEMEGKQRSTGFCLKDRCLKFLSFGSVSASLLLAPRASTPPAFFLRQGKIHGVDMNKCLDSFASLTDLQGLCLDLEGTQFFSVSVENSSHSK